MHFKAVFFATFQIVIRASSGSPFHSDPSHQTPTGFENSVYFASWAIYDRHHLPQALPADKITSVIYSFSNFEDDGTVVSSDPWADIEARWPGDLWDEPRNHAYGCIKQLYLLKKANRNMKVILSVGGRDFSRNGRFASAVSSAAKRAQFANSSVSLMKDWGFDGIDVDWEFPSNAAEANDLVSLLRAVRSALDSYAAQTVPGYHFLLSAAMPAGPEYYESLPLAAVAGIADSLNLMAYDYAGPFSSFSGHQANLYPNLQNPESTPSSTDKAISDYLAAGVPASKIALGMPVYGHVFNNTLGLGKPCTAVATETAEDGIRDYMTLGNEQAQSDPVSHATYVYDSANQQLISFDTAEMVTEKVNYIKERRLRGSIFWEASKDRTDSQSLVAASYSALGEIRHCLNNLHYPESVYTNIAEGMN